MFGSICRVGLCVAQCWAETESCREKINLFTTEAHSPHTPVVLSGKPPRDLLEK